MARLSLGSLIAGAGALAGGYVKGDQMRRGEEQAAEDRRMRQEEHQLRVDAARRDEENRRTLADAARPATVETNITNDDDGNPSSAPALRMVGPGPVQNFNDRAAADAAAKGLNDPGARDQRISLALAQTGNPLAAKQYEGAALGLEREKRAEADRLWRDKVGTAMQAGHDGLADLVSQTEAGPMAGRKLKAVPSADGKTITYNLVGDDGTLTPTKLTFENNQDGVIRAGYMLDRSVSPEHRITVAQKDREISRKEDADSNRALYQQGLIETKIKQLELTGQVAEAKALAAAAKASANGGPLAREERIRYTSLFEDAGRRLSEAQKARAKLTSGMDGTLFLKKAQKDPNSPEAQQLRGLEDDITSYKRDRDTWQGLLAGSARSGDEKPSPGGTPKPAAAPAASGEPVRVTTRAERDKLPKGTRYVGPDGVTYTRQ